PERQGEVCGLRGEAYPPTRTQVVVATVITRLPARQLDKIFVGATIEARGPRAGHPTQKTPVHFCKSRLQEFTVSVRFRKGDPVIAPRSTHWRCLTRPFAPVAPRFGLPRQVRLRIAHIEDEQYLREDSVANVTIRDCTRLACQRGKPSWSGRI